MARPLNTGLGVPGRGVRQQGPEPAPWVSWLQEDAHPHSHFSSSFDFHYLDFNYLAPSRLPPTPLIKGQHFPRSLSSP